MNPFQASKAIGDNFGKIYQSQNDRETIDDVLQKYESSGYSQEGYNSAIEQTLKRAPPEKRKELMETLKSRHEQEQKKAEIKQKKDYYTENGMNPNLVYQPAFVQQAAVNANEKAKLGSPEEQEFKKSQVKNSMEFMNKGFEAAAAAEQMDYVFDEIMDASQGDIAGPGLLAAAKNNPYLGLIVGLTVDEARMETSNKLVMESNKGIFGPKPTEREIFILLEKMLPSISKTPEANASGIKFMKKANEIKKQRGEVIAKLTDNGKKYVPNLERVTQEMMRPYINSYRRELTQAVNEIEAPKAQEETKNKNQPKEPQSKEQRLKGIFNG